MKVCFSLPVKTRNDEGHSDIYAKTLRVKAIIEICSINDIL